MPLSPGVRVGPYEILAALGAGGMGEVYRARDPRLGRDVAVKILPVAFRADPERRLRFEQEARAAAALNHPHILSVYDIGEHDGLHYIVSELLDGETLREQFRTAFRQPARKAIKNAVQLARALAAAHEKGIVHRDLKPENILVAAAIAAAVLAVRYYRRSLEPGPVVRFMLTPPGNITFSSGSNFLAVSRDGRSVTFAAAGPCRSGQRTGASSLTWPSDRSGRWI